MRSFSFSRKYSCSRWKSLAVSIWPWKYRNRRNGGTSNSVLCLGFACAYLGHLFCPLKTLACGPRPRTPRRRSPRGVRRAAPASVLRRGSAGHRPAPGAGRGTNAVSTPTVDRVPTTNPSPPVRTDPLVCAGACRSTSRRNASSSGRARGQQHPEPVRVLGERVGVRVAERTQRCGAQGRAAEPEPRRGPAEQPDRAETRARAGIRGRPDLRPAAVAGQLVDHRLDAEDDADGLLQRPRRATPPVQLRRARRAASAGSPRPSRPRTTGRAARPATAARGPARRAGRAAPGSARSPGRSRRARRRTATGSAR